MTFTYRHRKQIFLAVLVTIILGLGSFFVYRTSFVQQKEEKPILLKKKESQKETEVAVQEEVRFVQVDIKGAVNQPGIYRMEEGSRVIDVIHQAGELRQDADTTVINLSKKVFDEMVIIIYTQEEVQNFKATKEEEAQVIEQCQQGLGDLQNDACIGEETPKEEKTKVSLNQATKEELMTLSGIGDAKADAILAYRNAHGGFQTIEELKEVEGIGEALFASIAENITL